MGLFEFLKKSGAKVLTKKNAKTVDTPEVKKMKDEILRKQKIVLLKGIVDSLKINVDNMDLDYDDSTVTIYGQVEDQEQKEKIVIALGNVSGVAAVNDKLKVVNKAPEADFYTVKRGDSLSKIALKYYGNAKKYNTIFKANKPMLKDPDKIYPGQVLRIPKL